MRKKPKGRKYRNLYARGSSIYYERVLRGKTIKRSLRTDSWEDAASLRDMYEERKGIGKALELRDTPTFAEAAAVYLDRGMKHLAASTCADRKALLRAEGEILQALGGLRLDEITRATLLGFWEQTIEGAGRKLATGRNYLDAVAGVYGYAIDREWTDASPVEAFRGTLRRRNRTRDGRASAAAVYARPIEAAPAVAAFVFASLHPKKPTAEHRNGAVADLLMLDAGLRLGEVEALTWGDIFWGRDLEDTRRHIRVSRSVSRGLHDGPTKSGRARSVALSLRLRRLLRERWMEDGQPRASARVLRRFHRRNYYSRHFEPTRLAAGVPELTPKGLRDTYASHLLSAGVALGYVSAQLGHSDIAVTARHYARWVGDERYVDPPRLGAGEVPADLIARLGQEEETESHQKSPQLGKSQENRQPASEKAQ